VIRPTGRYGRLLEFRRATRSRDESVLDLHRPGVSASLMNLRYWGGRRAGRDSARALRVRATTGSWEAPGGFGQGRREKGGAEAGDAGEPSPPTDAGSTGRDLGKGLRPGRRADLDGQYGWPSRDVAFAAARLPDRSARLSRGSACLVNGSPASTGAAAPSFLPEFPGTPRRMAPSVPSRRLGSTRRRPGCLWLCVGPTSWSVCSRSPWELGAS